MKQLDWTPPDDRNVANVWPWLCWLYIAAAPNLTFVPVLLCPVSLVSRLGRPPRAPAAVLWQGIEMGELKADV